MEREINLDGVVRDLDWNLLHTFVVIIDAGGITSAADKLNRTQPTISNALSRLEQQIGKRLIERSRGVFRLTDPGRLLYEEAIHIYGAVNRLRITMRDVTNQSHGHVRIVMASHIVCPLLDKTLQSFHISHPKATLSLDVMASAAALSEVRSRRASLAICLVRERDPGLEYRCLYREFFGLFCGPGHPLFGIEKLTKSDLTGHSVVSFSTDRFDDVLRPMAMIRDEAELDNRIVGRSSHLEEVKRMTIAGLGIGVLPIHVVKRDIDDGLLWRMPPYQNPPAIDVYLSWNPKTRLNRAEAVFLKSLLNCIEQTPMAQRTYRN